MTISRNFDYLLFLVIVVLYFLISSFFINEHFMTIAISDLKLLSLFLKMFGNYDFIFNEM